MMLNVELLNASVLPLLALFVAFFFLQSKIHLDIKLIYAAEDKSSLTSSNAELVAIVVPLS